MFDFSKGINSLNNSNNKLVGNYHKNFDGGRRSLEDVREDTKSAEIHANKRMIDMRNEREAKEKELLNTPSFKPNDSLSKASTFNNNVNNMRNLKRGNF